MRMHKTLLGLISIAGLLLGARLAMADDPAAAEPLPPLPGREFCKENPGKCAEARARRQAFCEKNPEKCEQMKQKLAERRNYCRQNPEKCEQQREERQKRHAEMQAKCAADPAKCNEMKQQMRERHQQHQGMGGSAAQPAPAP